MIIFVVLFRVGTFTLQFTSSSEQFFLIFGAYVDSSNHWAVARFDPVLIVIIGPFAHKYHMLTTKLSRPTFATGGILQ